ncbi:MAG: hypothetical protein JKY67_11815 [Pseudomonadales bacterium]|nr:hypothetical protein [Pseudomonadales bacterium]
MYAVILHFFLLETITFYSLFTAGLFCIRKDFFLPIGEGAGSIRRRGVGIESRPQSQLKEYIFKWIVVV